MKKVLFINACTRKSSRTYELTQALLDKIGGDIEEIDLYEQAPAPLDEKALIKREELVSRGEANAPELRYALDFSQADTIVIAAPYWDLLFPAVLRCYLENVCVSGITFRYSDKGFPVGLCRGKKLYYVTTAGGYIGSNNFGFDYVSALSKGMFSIEEVVCITAEGLDIIGNDAREILRNAKEKILSDPDIV